MAYMVHLASEQLVSLALNAFPFRSLAFSFEAQQFEFVPLEPFTLQPDPFSFAIQLVFGVTTVTFEVTVPSVTLAGVVVVVTEAAGDGRPVAHIGSAAASERAAAPSTAAPNTAASTTTPTEPGQATRSASCTEPLANIASIAATFAWSVREASTELLLRQFVGVVLAVV